jgi:hypothetical protein
MLPRAHDAADATSGQGSASRSSSGSRHVRSSRLLLALLALLALLLLLLPPLKAAPALRAAAPTPSIRLCSSSALEPRTCTGSLAGVPTATPPASAAAGCAVGSSQSRRCVKALTA